ncbi:MAG: nucleoid occlusion factor SlmA [Magnetococcales bacterium]|nr:nucleoid occlusion factor SlmA [Magnetococcales bacterium]
METPTEGEQSLPGLEPETEGKESPPRADRRRRPERKIEILQAVSSLMEEGGRKVTTAAVAERLGLSEAALYRHFRGKEAMFQALGEYLESHLLHPVNQMMDSGESALTQLARLFDYHLRFFDEHPGLCRLFLVEGVSGEAASIGVRMVALHRKYTSQVKQLLRRGQAEGEIPPHLPVESAALLFVGLIQARTLQYIVSGFQDHPPRHGSEWWNFFLRAILFSETVHANDD